MKKTYKKSKEQKLISDNPNSDPQNSENHYISDMDFLDSIKDFLAPLKDRGFDNKQIMSLFDLLVKETHEEVMAAIPYLKELVYGELNFSYIYTVVKTVLQIEPSKRELMVTQLKALKQSGIFHDNSFFEERY